MNQKNNHYTCPMHREVISDTPGPCPKCGMALALEQAGRRPHGESHEHDKHAGHSVNVFRMKFWASLILSIPVVLYSDIVKSLFAWQPLMFPGAGYIPFVGASIIFFYGGSVFLVSALRELGARLPGMMTLVSLAITTSYVYSVYAVFTGRHETLFWELATLITIMLLGHWLEMRAVSGAQGALRELSKLLPDMAEIIQGEHTRLAPLSELKLGAMVLVKPGAKIPADGEVVNGNSYVDESLVTGESKPIPKLPGSQVIAGTVNGDGALRVSITKIGSHTFLAGVLRLVEEAQASKSRLQMLSDRAAFYLTLVAVTAGLVTFVAWIGMGRDAAFAVERLVAVLVIACPHALGLAVPLVASISTAKAARNGFLVRQRLALEAARNIDIVLFDKTGTLTQGRFGVGNVWTLAKERHEEVIRLAASVDAYSEHPIANAIVAYAREHNIELVGVREFSRLPGKGARGIIGDVTITVGGAGILEGVPFVPTEEMHREQEKGKTIVYVVQDREVLGAIALHDVIRDESREAIAELTRMGIEVAMITGDGEDVARWVARELGFATYFARALPHEKAEKVKSLKALGKQVAMVGDGVNDAPALTHADLGIAIGAGTNVAIESAGIVLVKNDPRDIPRIIRLARMTYRKMFQNLLWATCYNVIAIPLAAGVLAEKGIMLEPALAAVFMSLSTVIVAVNAMLLKNRAL